MTDQPKLPPYLTDNIHIKDDEREWRRLFIVQKVWLHMKAEMEVIGYNKSDIVNAALIAFYSRLSPQERHYYINSQFLQNGLHEKYDMDKPAPLKEPDTK